MRLPCAMCISTVHGCTQNIQLNLLQFHVAVVGLIATAFVVFFCYGFSRRSFVAVAVYLPNLTRHDKQFIIHFV